jgi:hypothetical protein
VAVTSLYFVRSIAPICTNEEGTYEDAKTQGRKDAWTPHAAATTDGGYHTHITLDALAISGVDTYGLQSTEIEGRVETHSSGLACLRAEHPSCSRAGDDVRVECDRETPQLPSCRLADRNVGPGRLAWSRELGPPGVPSRDDLKRERDESRRENKSLQRSTKNKKTTLAKTT